MPTINENLQRLQTCKSDISSAITTKGGTVSSGDGFEEFPADIATIPTTKSIYAFLYLAVNAGATATVSKDGITLTQTSSAGEELLFEIPSSGTWSISVSKLGEATITDNIVINEQKDYYLEMAFAHIYGVVWDKTSTATWSNPQLTRTDESASFVDPDPYVADGNHPGSSPFDNLMPWSGMIKETIDGNVLVKIPKFWYKITNDSSQLKIQISDSAQDGFKVSPAHQARNANESDRDYVYIGRYKCSRSNYKSVSGVSPKVSITRAKARSSISNLGANYWQQDFAMFWTIRLLYLVEFANWNSQEKIGYGCGNGSSVQNTGASDSMPYHTGTMQSSKTAYGVGCQYRWIEDLWGNVYEWIDGIYFLGSSVYIITDPSSFLDSSGGTLVGTRTSNSGEIKDFFAPSEATLDWAIYPNRVYSDSSYSTYVTDNCSNSSSSSGLRVGGIYYSLDQEYGLFCMNGLDAASYSSIDIGTRLMYLP